MTECKQFLYNERYLHQVTLLIASPVAKWSLKDWCRKIIWEIFSLLFRSLLVITIECFLAGVSEILLHFPSGNLLLIFPNKIVYDIIISHMLQPFVPHWFNRHQLSGESANYLSLCVFFQLSVFQNVSIIFFSWSSLKNFRVKKHIR